MNPGNFIKIDDNGRIKKSVSKYKFNQIEFEKIVGLLIHSKRMR